MNIAKLAQQLASEPETPMLKQIPRMEQICREQLRDAMRALVDISEDAARGVAQRDDEIDHLYNSVYEDAIAMMTAAPERARQANPIVVVADPADCHFQFDPVGKKKFTSSCDVATAALHFLADHVGEDVVHRRPDLERNDTMAVFKSSVDVHDAANRSIG